MHHARGDDGGVATVTGLAVVAAREVTEAGSAHRRADLLGTACEKKHITSSQQSGETASASPSFIFLWLHLLLFCSQTCTHRGAFAQLACHGGVLALMVRSILRGQI